MSRPVSETLGYLLVQICRAHRNRALALLAELDLHPGQEFLLQRLWEEDGQAQSELSEELCVQPATLTRSVDRMVKAGLITRRTDPDDRRVSRVHLTEAGKALRQPVEEALQQLEKESFANLSLEERILLRRLLLQVQVNLE